PFARQAGRSLGATDEGQQVGRRTAAIDRCRGAARETTDGYRPADRPAAGGQMSDLPRITVVTPSLNQGRYIEDAIRSVLDQGYPNLEIIVRDGGSTDGSIEVLRRYERRLSRV